MAVKPNVFPAEEARCARYAVTLDGAPADVLAARVSAMPYNCEWPGHQRPLDQTEIAGFVVAAADGPVEVCVTVDAPFEELTVRPLRHGIRPVVEGCTARFTLPGPGQYTLEPDGYARALHLFISPLTAPAAPAGADTLYYGPGVHEIGIVELRSNQTVIIDEGAVVYGGFVAFDAENVTVTGRGILDGSKEIRTSGTLLIAVSTDDPCYAGYGDAGVDFLTMPTDDFKAWLDSHGVLNGCLRFYRCRNVTVSGITCRDASSFTIVPAACDNVLIDDVKLIGMWRYNSDGIDLFNTSNCIIRNSFLRNFDDCVVIKGINGWQGRPNENILVENCVLWCDWGRPLELGAETNATAFNNITLKNCDVIHGTWLQLDIQHHNNAPIHDIVFEDIRCEYTRHQLPLKMQPGPDVAYEDAPTLFAQPELLGAFFYDMGRFGAAHAGEQIRRIRFVDIQVLCDEEVPMPPCRFVGLDAQNSIHDVVIENLSRNGVPLQTPAGANLQCNEYVYDVTLR